MTKNPGSEIKGGHKDDASAFPERVRLDISLCWFWRVVEDTDEREYTWQIRFLRGVKSRWCLVHT